MHTETCHTCDIDEHCDSLKLDVAELEREKDMLEIAQQFAEDNVPELVILERMPKITPASAKRETGGKVGTRGDININLVSKRGVSVERAAEEIYERYGPEAENLLSSEFDEARIREEIIEILKVGKVKYRAQILTDVGQIEHEIDEKLEQFKDECIGDAPTFDLDAYQHAKALAVAMAMKYKYAA